MVVDSNDRQRLEDARDELMRMCAENEVRGIPLLVYAHKQDLPQSMTVDEIADGLDLHTLTGQRPWYVQPSSIEFGRAGGEGLYEGLQWIYESIHNR